MNPTFTITAVGALLVVAVASITDIRSGKIYNWLTLPALLIGIIARAVEYAAGAPDSPWLGAMAGAANGLLGAVVGLLSLGIFKCTIMRALGGGDVKLMGALGAFIGPGLIFATFIYHCLAFGVYTMGIMAFAFPWRQMALAYATKTQGVVNMDRFNQVRKAPLPVAPFIAVGLLAVILFREQTRQFFGF